MERNLKEQIVKSAKAVKRKVEMIKDANNTKDMALETLFKPIVDPLNLLTSKTAEKYNNTEETEQSHPIKRMKYSDSESSNSICENFDAPESDEGGISDHEVYRRTNKTLTTSPSEDVDINENSFKSLQSSPSITNVSSWSTSAEVMKNIPYGVRNERGKLWLGNTRVYDDGRSVKIGNRSLDKTDGIKELLYKKTPNLNLVTEEDLQNYKLVLIDTNAHKRNYDPLRPVNSNKGFKYMNIIKPLFKFSRNHTSSLESLPQGKGINLLKEVKKDTDLVYWNDPNELVERLKLLLPSWAAGNTGVRNEIYSIIEEMHEAGIIKQIKYITLPSGGLRSITALQKPTRRQ